MAQGHREVQLFQRTGKGLARARTDSNGLPDQRRGNHTLRIGLSGSQGAQYAQAAERIGSTFRQQLFYVPFRQ